MVCFIVLEHLLTNCIIATNKIYDRKNGFDFIKSNIKEVYLFGMNS